MEGTIKLCECGCGQPAPINKDRHLKRGYVLGQPVRFIKGHGARVCHHDNLPGVTWTDLKELYIDQQLSTIEIAKQKGCSQGTVGEHLEKMGIPARTHSEQMSLRYKKHPPTHQPTYKRNGYILLYMPDHPYHDQKGYVPEHRLVMEKELGRYLLRTEQVHHRPDVAKSDNRIEVLYYMPDPGSHSRLAPCSHCELKKEIRLLRWHIIEQNKQIANLTAEVFGRGAAENAG